MRLHALVVLLVATGCGARSGWLFGPEPEPDGAVDAGLDAGPACGGGPACGAGSYCCADERCVPDGSCCTHEDCTEGYACLPGGVCGIGDLGCGLEELVPDVRPADVMLMLDRSESMAETIEGRTKWEIANQSLHEVLPDYEGLVRFGLTLLPGQLVSSCIPGAVTNDVGDSVAAILETLDATIAGSGGTPLGSSLETIRNSGQLDDPTHASFVVMLSDGSETCRGQPVDVTRQLYDRDPRIQVYPVGFGRGVDQALLQEIARASHTENGSGRGYWTADDASGLTRAFDSVLTSVIQCELPLDPPPPDPDAVYAFLNDAPVALDPANGFTVDRATNRIAFAGAACDTVRTPGARIVVVFGCPDED